MSARLVCRSLVLAGTLVWTAANGQIYVDWDEQGELVLSDRPFPGATRTHSLPVGGAPAPDQAAPVTPTAPPGTTDPPPATRPASRTRTPPSGKSFLGED